MSVQEEDQVPALALPAGEDEALWTRAVNGASQPLWETDSRALHIQQAPVNGLLSRTA